MGLLSEPDYDAQHLEDERAADRIEAALLESEEEDRAIEARLAELEAESIALEAEAARLAHDVAQWGEERGPGLVKAPRLGVVTSGSASK